MGYLMGKLEPGVRDSKLINLLSFPDKICLVLTLVVLVIHTEKIMMNIKGTLVFSSAFFFSNMNFGATH